MFLNCKLLINYTKVFRIHCVSSCIFAAAKILILIVMFVCVIIFTSFNDAFDWFYGNSSVGINFCGLDSKFIYVGLEINVRTLYRKWKYTIVHCTFIYDMNFMIWHTLWNQIDGSLFYSIDFSFHKFWSTSFDA